MELEKNSETNPTKPMLIYRGIGTAHDRDRIGSWWTTHPYLALRYADRGSGVLFVASIVPEVLAALAQDVEGDGYENYIFSRQDPPNVRQATNDEIDQLKAAITYIQVPGIAVNPLPSWPEDPISIGEEIFAPQTETQLLGRAALR